MKRILDLFRRGKIWKDYVQASLLSGNERLAALEEALSAFQQQRHVDRREIELLHEEISGLRRQRDALALQAGISERLRRERFVRDLTNLAPALADPEGCILLARRGDAVNVLCLPRIQAERKRLAGNEPIEVLSAICDNAIRTIQLLVPERGGWATQPVEALLSLVRSDAEAAYLWLTDRQPAFDTGYPLPDYFDRLDAILAELDLIDFYANGEVAIKAENAPPFAMPAHLPPYLPAQPKARSVLFPHHCYYNFYYLAKELRRRGWDAVTLSIDAPGSDSLKYSHGEDIRIYNEDRAVQHELVTNFFTEAMQRFGIIHTYGIGILSLFEENYDKARTVSNIPWDILEAKRRGILLGYSHCGCMDAVSQSTFRDWSPSMCAKCVWESRPDVCSDHSNLAWGRKMTSIVDLFCIETDPPLDFKASPNAFRGPLTFAIDPDVWRTNLNVPDRFRRERAEGEVIVYHAMGNYELRPRNGHNVKGTQAIVTAVEELRAEGIPIRLDFVTDVASIDNRFVQTQADIIVDQLNYGRYGALAREGMMLGKPVVGRVNKMDGPDLPASQCILDTPIVHAEEQTIKDVLRDLALNPQKRQEIGIRSREHAIHWWSAERLAARFEQVYDHVREYGVPPAEEDVH